LRRSKVIGITDYPSLLVSSLADIPSMVIPLLANRDLTPMLLHPPLIILQLTTI